MSDILITKIIFAYISSNIVLYVIAKNTSRFNLLHRILSIANTFALWGITCGTVYLMKPILVVVAAIVLLFEYPIIWGIRTELTEDEAESLVIMRGGFFLPEKLRRKIKLLFLEIVTFPFFYLMKSWKKSAFSEYDEFTELPHE